jgi:class 3 adenylate cyclase
VLLDGAAGPASLARLLGSCRAGEARPPVLVLLPATDNAAGEEAVALWTAAGAAEVVAAPLTRSVLQLRLATQLRLRQVSSEATSSLALLRRMLPDGVISRLKDGQTLIAESMDSVTVLFSDVVSFTSLASQLPTTDLIMMLNDLFSAFDALCDKHKLFKVRAWLQRCLHLRCART